MQAALNARVAEAFAADQAERVRFGTRVACALGIGSFLSFFLIDPLLVEDVRPLYIARVLSILLIGAVLAATFRPVGRHTIWLGVAGCTAIGAGVVTLTALTGGGDSTYHEALLLTFFGFALMVPLPPRVAGLTFAGQVLAYDVTLLATGQTGGAGHWVANNGILWVGVGIATAGAVLSRNLRLQQFEGAFHLAQAHDELQTLDRAKSRFFANLSHELRTPLTLTLAPVEALLDDPGGGLAPAQRDRLQLVRANALRLLRLVDDLLELSKLEAATVRLQVQPVEMAGWLHPLVEQVSALAARRRITMTFEAEAPLPAVILDPHQVERVVLNLLANAVKFTGEQGTVAVSVRADGEGVRVDVRDDGIGIPEEQVPHIFERFHQVDTSSTRRHGGAGIGLALARDLVALHGGTIGARSTFGEGTTMSFWLPTAGPDDSVIDRRQRQRAVPDDRRDGGLSPWQTEFKGRDSYRMQGVEDASERRVLPRPARDDQRTTILLVEDNEDLVRFLASLLGTDHRVLHAPNGEIGLRLARTEHPDLIVSDVMMPVMDGLEMVRRLRDGAETAALPVLMLTARGSSRDRVQGRSGGADAYLTKPFKPAELRAAVDGLLRKQSARRRGARATEDRVLSALAAGVAHEILNPLTFLQNALFVLRETAGELLAEQPDAESSEVVDGAYAAGRSGIDRVRAAVADLRDLGVQREDEAPRELALNDVAARVLKLSGPRRTGQRVEGRLEATGRILAQQGQLERAVVHLILNAQQASGLQGRVRLTTWDSEDGVALAVEDDGPGVAPDQRATIFTPYFTTRDDGTGLGLALARSAVVAQGGTLELDTSVERGARFVIRLPRLPDPSPQATEGEPS